MELKRAVSLAALFFTLFAPRYLNLKTEYNNYSSKPQLENKFLKSLPTSLSEREE
jgi:hypothetical protein